MKINDKDLLKLAAIAGGYDHLEFVDNEPRDGRIVTGHYDPLNEEVINPLLNNGDAFSLAVKLKLHVDCHSKIVYSPHGISQTIYNDGESMSDEEIMRRVIVMVAAEIGCLIAVHGVQNES